MKILQVDLCSNLMFRATLPSSYVKKNAMYKAKQAVKTAVTAVTKEPDSEKVIKEASDIIKSKGITFCEYSGERMNIAAGYNNGFYSVKLPQEILDNVNPKVYLANVLMDDESILGGLLNYMNVVKNFKRQDIIQKGLQIHTYELNNYVPYEQKQKVATVLSKYTKRNIRTKNLFYVNSDAYYYDKYSEKVYSINMDRKHFYGANNMIQEFEFVKNGKGNAIGYNRKRYDIFQNKYIEEKYVEQQSPSEKLPKIADSINNKLFAEAFRFGNSEPEYKYNKGIPNVLEHLNKRVGITLPKKEDLQFVQFYDNDRNIVLRINYYDPTTGRSLVYNQDGKYMYQMEYNKDDSGNIIACSKF